MIATDTLNYLKNYAEPCLIDECSEKNYLCSDNYPNYEPMISNEETVKKSTIVAKPARTNKSYEKSNNCLIESYFELDDTEDSTEFTGDYAKSFPNGIIMVINDGLNSTDIHKLKTGFNTQLKYLIVCNTANYSSVNSSSINYSEIAAENLDKAAQTAYNLVSNGQAILFQGVGTNFDLFSHL